ncbi:MAG TPA: ATP-binding protein [Aggregatilineaceae bacterium]|nr:ATP-binding protein [Aggregatilineaceae bacterium]
MLHLQISDNLDLSAEVKVVFYRVMQETINNIVKHSHASQMSIKLYNSDNLVTLKIKDNGIGFDTSQAMAGIGLHSMRERADAIGGTLEIQSAHGEGTCITLVWSKPE